MNIQHENAENGVEKRSEKNSGYHRRRKNICLYFHVHQPFRLRKYNIFDIKRNHNYFDDKKNKEVLLKVAHKCYLPANKLMLELIRKHPEFKVSYSITGVIIEQFERYCPQVLQSFKDLAATGQVEFVAETYYHSLAFLHSTQEFFDQVDLQVKTIQKHFNQTPVVFRNTELIFNNHLAWHMQQKGYKAILAEGADHIMQWRSPNYVYHAKTAPHIKLLLKNYKLSDDIAFRFGNRSWGEYPLTADKYAAWVDSTDGEIINLFMDYETFGEHQWADTGIFTFMKHLPEYLIARGIGFVTPSEAADLEAKGELDIHNFISWADIERDLSAWMGNKLQDSALQEIYKIEEMVKETRDPQIIDDWRKLQTSDHFYYMCIKYFSDGDVHKYFNPYDSPYDGFIIFMNILNDLLYRIEQKAMPKLQSVKQDVYVHHMPQMHHVPVPSRQSAVNMSWTLNDSLFVQPEQAVPEAAQHVTSKNSPSPS